MVKIYAGDLPGNLTDPAAFVKENGVEQAEAEALIAEMAATVQDKVKHPRSLDRLTALAYAKANNQPVAAAVRAPGRPVPTTLESIANAVYRQPNQVAQAAVEGQADDDLRDLVAEIDVEAIYARYNSTGQKPKN